MDFIIIANTWSAGKDNPTSKHRIAMELVRRGCRVLWIEGSGMRAPSLGSGHDRLRMVRKVGAAFRGARRIRLPDLNLHATDQREVRNGNESLAHSSESDASGALWVLSPLFIPLPKFEIVRRLNGLICRCCMKFWGWKLGFLDTVLINYVPVLAEAMRGWHRMPQTSDHRPWEEIRSQIGATAEPSAVAPLCERTHSDSRREGRSGRSPILDSPSSSKVCSSRVVPTGGAMQGKLGPEVSQCTPRVVYHCVDRWDAFSTYDSRMMSEMDRRCCVYADIVLASSQDLVERCRRHSNNVRLLSHGVDHEHFAQALRVTVRPDDLPAGRVAGFFGLLSEWLDQDLLVELAQRVPECGIVLIGKADVNVDRLKGIGNIHLLGPRPFHQLPEYVAHFDVGLIPFVVNELTVAVNPIKLREMLAAGCPVVSTALPEVERCAREIGVERDVVAAAGHEAFIEAVMTRLAAPLSRETRQRISEVARVESWSGKVDKLLEWLR